LGTFIQAAAAMIDDSPLPFDPPAVSKCVRMTHQEGAGTCWDAVAGRLRMARQNIGFVDALIGEKAIRRFGVRPVLTSHGNALANRIACLF
jgi:hypothetical protein